jgi:hypothetical protein
VEETLCSNSYIYDQIYDILNKATIKRIKQRYRHLNISKYCLLYAIDSFLDSQGLEFQTSLEKILELNDGILYCLIITWVNDNKIRLFTDLIIC